MGDGMADEWMYDLAVTFANMRREPKAVPALTLDGKPTGLMHMDPEYLEEVVACIKRWAPGTVTETVYAVSSSEPDRETYLFSTWAEAWQFYRDNTAGVGHLTEPYSYRLGSGETL